MFKRKDWVLLRRGQGVEGDANSTSSSSDQSQESDAVSSSSESLDVSTGSSEREEEGQHVRLERSSRLGSLSGEESDSLDSDGADVRAQVRCVLYCIVEHYNELREISGSLRTGSGMRQAWHTGWFEGRL